MQCLVGIRNSGRFSQERCNVGRGNPLIGKVVWQTAILGACMWVWSVSASAAAGEPGFSDVVLDKQFQPYLLGNPLLMELAGAKVIRDKGGRTILLAVASTAMKDNSPADRLRAEKVCRVKAFAAMVAEKKGIQVCHTETLNENTKVVIDEKGESATSVSDLIQVTKTKVEGIARDMPVIGRWRNKDGDIFYLAIGVIVDKNGKPVKEED